MIVCWPAHLVCGPCVGGGVAGGSGDEGSEGRDVAGWFEMGVQNTHRWDGVDGVDVVTRRRQCVGGASKVCAGRRATDARAAGCA